jgi:hypothetical protein
LFFSHPVSSAKAFDDRDQTRYSAIQSRLEAQILEKFAGMSNTYFTDAARGWTPRRSIELN